MKTNKSMLEREKQDQIYNHAPDMFCLLTEIELLIRVNCPINYGSPMHKSINNLLNKLNKRG
jgi:hypothetical protein